MPTGLVFSCPASPQPASLKSQLMNLFPFVISQTIRMLLNFYGAKRQGCWLIFVCSGVMICMTAKLPLDLMSNVANLHTLQSVNGARQGKSGQQMSLRIFLCRYCSPNSLSFLRFQKLGLVGYDKCCILPLCPTSATITATNTQLCNIEVF